MINKKITRNDINKNNMVALGYCECQTVLNMFGDSFKIGYNAGVYGWNYDLYYVNGVNIVTGYRVPYTEYSNRELKKKLVALENKIRKQNLSFGEYEEAKENWRQEFLRIFE